ncbi:MAG: HK97-gp10 family putative phage morphogenesis protein [Parvibaculum sp.]|uniref:HK97-gp10 family putative phage morphogenesis protein n=1 Tax=Parvibaculum sp. TaxID=2024848 RepID=UPI002ABCF113|nr:HK97-gp10 family putative phage morphogenesis protein [Parvibaculum sp.]MDZ4382805.1 HK97-gp10 family putative phage morphogenesis protein [Parvibaculum sp.]
MSIGKEFSVARSRAKVKRRLKAIVEAARPAITKEMASAASEVVTLMRRLVPVASGTLRDSIDWTYGNPPATRATGAFRPKGEVGDSRSVVSIYAGDDDAFYARFVEFGTQGGPAGKKVRDASGRKRKLRRTHPGTDAQPFFFPAWRAKRPEIKKRIRKAQRKAVKKAMESGK